MPSQVTDQTAAELRYGAIRRGWDERMRRLEAMEPGSDIILLVHQSEKQAVVERWFAALLGFDIEGALACWKSGAVWHVADKNELGGDHAIEDYLASLGGVSAEYGSDYEFHIDEMKTHGDSLRSSAVAAGQRSVGPMG